MRKIRRILRFFDFDIRQQKSKELWESVRFEPIAKKIQSYPAKEGANPSRYVGTNGERWLMDLRTIQKNKVIGVFWQTVVDGLPVEEIGGQFSPLGVAPGGGVAEPCVFGMYDNKYLIYEINKRGPAPGEIGAYVSELFGRRFKTDITLATLRTFATLLPKIAAFTVLHVRPRFDRMGKIRGTSNEDSLIRILKKLYDRSKQTVEVKISGGRHAHPEDAFEEEFADFLKDHLSDPDNYDDFDILRGAALLQSGQIRPIDIANRYVIEKRVNLRQDKHRGLDIVDAIRKIETAYVSHLGQLQDRSRKKRA